MVKLFKNVSVQDKSARESLNTFASGKGDVLIGYENEAIFAKKNGVQLQYIVPSSTILIENPLAAAKNAPTQAKAFVKWLKTPPSAEDLGENGYRPVVPSVLKQPSSRSRPSSSRSATSAGGTGLEEVVRPAERSDVKVEQGGSAWLNQSQSAPPSPRGGRSWSRLGIGVVTGYLSVIVLLPLAALVWEAHKGGLSGFWETISAPEAVAAIKLTLVASPSSSR